MRFVSFTFALLAGLCSVDEALALNVMETQKNLVKTRKNGKKMISVGLTQTEYDNTRYQDYIKPLSSESNMVLAQALKIPTIKSKDGQITLMQANQTTNSTSNSTRDRVDTELKNFKNMGYEGSFFFGEPSQDIQVIFDTGSAWAWVFSEDCGQKNGHCPLRKKKFQQSLSKNFQVNNGFGQKLQYGKGAIAGHPSQDKGCFSPDQQSCMSNINFLTVFKGKDLESLQGSGLIGLAPTPAQENELTHPLQQGISGFVAQLKQNNDYNHAYEQMFSIYLSNDHHSPGDISFGGYDLEKFAKKDAPLVWIDQSHNEFYWTVNTNGVNYGNRKLSTNVQQIIFDNGMSLAMVPEKSFVELIKSLHEYKFDCMEAKPVWKCKGDPKAETVPDIEFTVVKNPQGETANIKMPATAYIKRSMVDPSDYFLLVSPWQFKGMGGKDGEEYWVMGAQFLQNYYSIYDFKNKKVGLVESVTSMIGK